MLPVLALDTSKRATGWTCDGPDGKPRFGTWRDGANALSLGVVGERFNRFLSDMIDLFSPQLIAVEAPAAGGLGRGIFTSQDEAMLLFGLPFVAATVAQMNGLSFHAAHVQTVRKHFLGSGRPAHPKQAVMERCKLLGWNVKNSDEGDSAALWAYVKATKDPSYRIETGALFAGAGAIP